MKALGIHLLGEFWGCDRTKIDSLSYVEQVMSEIAQTARIKVLKTVFQKFDPQGVSGVLMVELSHFSIHTWPELGYAAVDIFTCDSKVDPWQAMVLLKEDLNAGGFRVRDFHRGLPSAEAEPSSADPVADHNEKRLWKPT